MALVSLGAVVAGCANGSIEELDEPVTEPDDGGGATTGDSSVRRDGSVVTPGRDGAAPSTDAATTNDSGVVTDGAVSDATVGTDSGTCVTVAPNNVCGLNPQCGCNATQTCDITTATTGAATCIAAGAQPAGQSCTTASNCARGLTCWNGACRPYCSRGQTTCAGGTICFAPTTGGVTSPNLDVCSVACDVRSPSTVCGTNGCSWFPTERAGDCRPPGTGLEFDGCAFDGDCRQGLACGDDPFFGPSCVRWCRLGSNADCALGDTCTDEYGANAPTSGGQRLGLCFF